MRVLAVKLTRIYIVANSQAPSDTTFKVAGGEVTIYGHADLSEPEH